MNGQAGFLNQDLPILQQLRSGFSPEFDVLDDQGQVVGTVAGTEGSARRFFLRPREFNMLDADSSRLAHLNDARDFWRDTYKIVRGNDSMLAAVARKVAFFSRRSPIVPSVGEGFMVEGSFPDRGFNVVNTDGGGAVTQAGRKRASFTRAFLGHGRYTLYYPPGTFPDRRLATLGSTTVLDLMQIKDVRSTISNGT